MTEPNNKESSRFDKLNTILDLKKHTIQQLELRVAGLEDKEHIYYKLLELALPDTSLFYLNLAAHKIQKLDYKELDSSMQQDYTNIIKLLDKTRDDLLALEFTAALRVLLELYRFVYTYGCQFDFICGDLEQAILKINLNMCLEQYIHEDNAPVN